MSLQIKANTSGNSSRVVVQQSRYGNLHTIQLENVSNQVKLSQILRAMVTDYKTIIGAIRVADYNTKILDSVVFLQFYDLEEAEKMLNTGPIFLFGQLIKFSNPFLVHGRIPFSFTYNVETEGMLNGIPVPMAVMNFNTKAESNTTIHSIKVLESFEIHAQTTSFRFAFDYKRNIIRNFGTVTFLRRQDALDSQQQEHFIMGNQLEVKIPRSFPILVHNSMSSLLNNHVAEFSSRLRDANWYHANLGDHHRPHHPIPTTMEAVEFPEVAEIPLPPEPQPEIQITPQLSRQLLDEAFRIASIDEEINRLQGGDNFDKTPPLSPVLSLGHDYDFDELKEEPPREKKRKLK